ncbi:Uncharacterised protein [uncultured archaeon]|nr:Uncharacterised protein [uncultured archaeon]
MNCPAVLEVAYQCNAQFLQVAFFLYGVEVQESLGWVMARSVSCVQDGHGRELRGKAGRALFGMADDQGVRIAAYNPHCVGQRLALRDGTALCRAQVDHSAAQTHHRCLKRHACARGRLEEQQSENLAGEHIARLASGIGLQIRCQVEDGVDLLPGELPHREDMPLLEHGHSHDSMGYNASYDYISPIWHNLFWT